MAEEPDLFADEELDDDELNRLIDIAQAPDDFFNPWAGDEVWWMNQPGTPIKWGWEGYVGRPRRHGAPSPPVPWYTEVSRRGSNPDSRIRINPRGMIYRGRRQRRSGRGRGGKYRNRRR